MISITTVFLIVLTGLNIVTLAILFLVGNWMYAMGIEAQKLSGGNQSVLRELTIVVDGLRQISSDIKKLDRMADATLAGTEALVDLAGARIEERQRPLRDGDFFTTDDGNIKSDNIVDFIEKLQQDPKYMDIAADLKSQLEKELSEDEDDEDSPEIPE